jgi:hypothetical protein
MIKVLIKHVSSSPYGGHGGELSFKPLETALKLSAFGLIKAEQSRITSTADFRFVGLCPTIDRD